MALPCYVTLLDLGHRGEMRKGPSWCLEDKVCVLATFSLELATCISYCKHLGFSVFQRGNGSKPSTQIK